MKKIDLSQNVPVVWKRLNKTETSSGKDENTRLHFWCFETPKQWII